MKSKTALAILCVMALPVLAFSQGAQQQFPREVTVTEIPGVVAAGAKWQQVWQGLDNADGILGLPDGSVIFAQEQPNTVRKLDKNDYDSAYLKDTHGAGSLWIDSKGRIIAPQKTCTDPGRGTLPCNEPTKIAVTVMTTRALCLRHQRSTTTYSSTKGWKTFERFQSAVKP